MNIKHSEHAATTLSAPGRWRALTSVLVVSALAWTLAACGGSTPSSDPDPDPTSTATTAAPEPSATETDADGLPTGLDPQPLAERTTIVVGLAVTSEAFLPVMVAEWFGEFEKENLDVEIEVAPDPASTIPLLDQGRLDVAATGPFAGLLNVQAEGSEVRWITGMGEAQTSPTSGGYYQRLPEDGSDPDPCALEGKRIGLVGTWTSSAALNLLKYLDQCDLGPDDVDVTTLDTTLAPEALRSGSVEMAYTLEPHTVQVVEDGIATQVVINPNGLGGFAAGSMINENPEAIQAFVRAMVRASQTYLQGDYRENPELLAHIAEWLGADEETILKSQHRLFDPYLSTDDLASLMEQLQPFWIEIGDILEFDTPLPVDQLVDNRFTDNTAK